MKITKKNLAILSALLFMIIIILYFVYQNIVYVSTDNAKIEGHAVLLTPKVTGFIIAVNFEQGQKVKKGQIIIEIDDRDAQNSLKQSKANLISVTAKLKDAESNYKRTERLYKIGAATQQQFDSTYANYSDIKAQMDSLHAQVAQAELTIEHTKIKAPRHGIIGKISAEVGQLAASGVPLIGFVDSEERWVIANFKETEIQSISPGSKAYIEIDAFPEKKYVGKVFSLSPATGATFTLLPPDNATGNFTKVVQRIPVKIKFEQLSEQDIDILKNGLSVFLKIKKT